jgi:hypothetical protein
MSKTCALRATYGRRLKHAPQSGPYEVCLSESQKRALFGDTKPKEAIGCGTFACVWPGARSSQVVKLTRDREDAEGLKAAQGIDRVVKVFSIKALPKAGRDVRTGQTIPVYAIVAERLKPLTKKEQKDLAKPLERARRTMIDRAKAFSKRGGTASSFGAPTGAERTELVGQVCAKTPGAGCERFAVSFFDAWAQMYRRGIAWQDAHTGNVAMDDQRRWKAIDLGFSGTKRRSNIPVLNGRFR